MKISVWDIGGTFVKYGIFQRGLEQTGAFPTNGSLGAGQLLARIRQTIRSQGPVDAIAVCTRGQVNAQSTQIIFDPPHVIPGYTGTNFKEALAEFGVPVFADNDVNCMALAEARFYPQDLPGDLICLTYGTAVGGAIVRGGKLYHGANWSAGEFGMLYACGAPGQYYEDIASVTALVEAVTKVDPSLCDGRKIAEAMDRPEIAAPVDAWVSKVAYGLASLIHIFDPSAVVIGGGLMENERIFSMVLQRTRQYAAPGFQVNLFPARDGNRAGLIGAALLAGNLL